MNVDFVIVVEVLYNGEINSKLHEFFPAVDT